MSYVALDHIGRENWRITYGTRQGLVVKMFEDRYLLVQMCFPKSKNFDLDYSVSETIQPRVKLKNLLLRRRFSAFLRCQTKQYEQVDTCHNS